MIKPAFALKGIGSTSSLEEMAKQHDAVAAINGTFFNAYDADDLHPMGAIMVDREFAHIRGGPIVMAVTASGGLEFAFNGLRIMGTVTRTVDNPSGAIFEGDKSEIRDSWYASFINHAITAPNEVVIFTPDYREQQLTYPDTVFIVVRDGIITDILQDTASIPDDGYVIAHGTGWLRQAKSFHIGDRIDYHVINSAAEYAQHLISVGPKLLTDGQTDVNMVRDGFTDPKMTTQSAGRSFIGAKEDGTILFGTVNHVTIPELAEVALSLGLSDAMALDGGASSGLYYNGKYLQKPGRLLSNSLVVVKQTRVPRIQIDGLEIINTQAGQPYIDNGSTMAPVWILESLGYSLTWSEDEDSMFAERMIDIDITNIAETPATNSESTPASDIEENSANENENDIVVDNGNTITGRSTETLAFTVDSETAVVNGVEVPLPTAAVMRDGVLYVPLRFVVESAGATIAWDSEQYLASILSESVAEDEEITDPETSADLE